MAQRLKRCVDKRDIARWFGDLRHELVAVAGDHSRCRVPRQALAYSIELSLIDALNTGVRIPRSLRAMAREIEREAGIWTIVTELEEQSDV